MGLCISFSSLLAVAVLMSVLSVGIGWWPFASSSDDTEPSTVLDKPQLLEQKAPVNFEMTSAEQRFLAEAQQFLDLSPLDHCQNTVISRLRKSCGEISEEELGKLAVHLLNCQAHTENRNTYGCTEAMSLADCTGPMDASTWNAYHIISNRARSVCYSTRQQQFRHQTELAVNKLSQSTIEQLGAVQQLASGHEQIKSIAEESLQTLKEHQDQLNERQHEVLASQEGVKDKIAENLNRLAEEKSLIHKGHEQLANMTHSIKQQLEEASGLLEEQDRNRQIGHSEIVQDINHVKKNIQQVWKRLDTSTSKLLNIMTEISSQYEATLHNLKLINSSVSSMMTVVLGMEQALSGQLDWLMGQLGGAQDGLRVLTTLTTHAVFLLLSTLCVLFVKAPAFSRILLLAMVTTNALSEIKFHLSLTFYALTSIQAMLIIGNWIYYWFKGRKLSPVPSVSYAPPGNMLRMRETTPTFPTKRSSPLNELNSSDDSADEHVPETICHTPTKQSLSEFMHSTPLRAPLGSLHHMTFGSSKCVARTKTGLQCKITASPGSNMCRRHARNH